MANAACGLLQEVAALLGDRPAPTGCLVGVCNLLDCFPTEDVRGAIGDVERLVGDFGDGRYAWQLSDVREFREPIPCRGAQGVWNALLSSRKSKDSGLVRPTVDSRPRLPCSPRLRVRDEVIYHTMAKWTTE